MFRPLLTFALAASGACGAETNETLDLSKYALKPVYQNEFAMPQKVAREEDFCAKDAAGIWKRNALPAADAEWIAEGTGGVEIRDGRLWIAPSPYDAGGTPRTVPEVERSHMVVWNRRVFPENFLFEVEMDSAGSTSGLTIVFCCAAGARGEDLFDLALPPRRADYKTYHSGAIANYSDAYWSRNTAAESATNRLRKNPGFAQVAEGPSHTAEPHPGPYRLRILKSGAHLEIEIDGQVILRWDDPEKPLGAGRIGLRSMAGMTQVSYAHFKVWEIAAKAVIPAL